jgi:type II secretory pathway pseudopilin PulG
MQDNQERAMKIKGLTLSELVVVVLAVLLLVGVLIPGLYRSRQTAVRLLCRTNLEGIGRAMTAFANNNAGRYPRAGGEGSYWSPTGTIWSWYGGRSGTEDEAFGIVRDPETGEILYPGEATITSSFYLLVKHSLATPKQFLCRGDIGAVEWRIEEHYYEAGRIEMDMRRAFDFGASGRLGGRTGPLLPYPGEVVSYSYHMPYSQEGSIETFVITDLSHPASPVCADRNPYLDKNAPLPPPPDPNGVRSFNSASHFGRGQNVLYKDGHVKFETSPLVGLAGDNIYTYRTSPGEDLSLGAGPVNDGDPLAYPWDETDALLLGERNGRTR